MMETERQITIGLPDGRHLGAALFGSGNVPFLFFHGLGGSRLSPGWMFPACMLQQVGVREPRPSQDDIRDIKHL
jgi:hypothetical protein